MITSEKHKDIYLMEEGSESESSNETNGKENRGEENDKPGEDNPEAMPEQKTDGEE